VWRLDLDWPEDTIKHIERHGISRKEIEKALEGRLYRRRSGSRAVVIGIGFGRFLFVVIGPSKAKPGAGQVVTARPARKAEKALFGRRGK